MGKVTIEYWECDCCKKRFDRESDLTKIQLPSRKYDRNGEKFTHSFTEVELCVECQEQLWNVCDINFATVEVGYQTKVFPHFDGPGYEPQEEE